jgi:uncharacterized protein YpuA (DUF1002 family)
MNSMNSEEFKKMTTSKYVLDYSSLHITLKEVAAIKDIKLTSEIERILKENKIEKPELHSKPYDETTDYFKIDLTSDQIEKIIDHFFNLETQFVGENGETTQTCAFYASLVDIWNRLAD